LKLLIFPPVKSTAPYHLFLIPFCGGGGGDKEGEIRPCPMQTFGAKSWHLNIAQRAVILNSSTCTSIETTRFL
jgi:hypothetical protein